MGGNIEKIVTFELHVLSAIHGMTTIGRFHCIRSHLDYGDVIYDQSNNDSFTDKIEQLQYRALLHFLQELFRGPHLNVFTMSLDLKVLVARGGAESFVVTMN